MHAFPHESLSNCATESNTGLKHNVNILGGWVGGGGVSCCDSPSGLCSIGMDHPPFTMPSQNKLHFKGSMLLLLKSVSAAQANTFCIDLSLLSPKTFIAIPSSEARI